METAKELLRRRAFTRVALLVALAALALPISFLVSAVKTSGGLGPDATASAAIDCCPLGDPLPSLTARIYAPDCPTVDGRSFTLTPAALLEPGEDQAWIADDIPMGKCREDIFCDFRLRCPILSSTRQGSDACFNYELRMHPNNSGCDGTVAVYRPAISCSCEPFALTFDGFCLKSNQYCPGCCDCCCQPTQEFRIVVELPQ